jgi:hypothetical protein
VPQTVRAGILRPRALRESVGALVSSKWPCWQASLSHTHTLTLASMEVSIEAFLIQAHPGSRRIAYALPVLCIRVRVRVCVGARP